MTSWPASDPKAAANDVDANFNKDKREGLLGTVFSTCAESELTEAWAWYLSANQDPEGTHNYRQLLNPLFQGMALKDLLPQLVCFNVGVGTSW